MSSIVTPSTPSTRRPARREEAINRGLSKRVEQLKVEQERRERAAQRADEEFSVEFLNAARAVFRMIDADGSGTLEKAEVVDAVKNNQKVIKFLETCGNPNLQYLLVPARLEAALLQLDTDRDGHIDEAEWCVSEPGTLGCLRRGDGVDAAHRSITTQGGVHRGRAVGEAGTARGQARGPGQGGRERSGGVHARLQERRAALF